MLPSGNILLDFIIKLFLHEKASLLENYIFYKAKNIFLKNADKSKEKKLRDRIHYCLKKLEKQQLIIKQKLDNRQNVFICPDKTKLLDLIIAPARPKPPEGTPTAAAEDANNPSIALNPRELIFPRYRRYAEEWKQAAEKLLTKQLSNVSSEDRELLELNFLAWTSRYEDRFLLFKTPEDIYEIKKASTRFTDEARAKQIIAKFEEAFNTAVQEHEEGVFLTITLPPCFSIRIQQLIISFIMHRLKALLRKQRGETVKHIRTNEPQKSLGYHTHVIFFGISWIMDKKLLTAWLDTQVENFLENMGNHYRRTINNRINEKEEERLNRYGKRLLKKYRRYKEKQREKAEKKGKSEYYRGPINFVTKVKFSDGDGEFAELPPDVRQFLEESSYDGGTVTVKQYIRKYIIKNLYAALQLQQGQEPGDIILIAWYWLTRSQFFTCSPSLRKRTPKPPPCGWQFIGSFTWDEIDDILTLKGYATDWQT